MTDSRKTALWVASIGAVVLFAVVAGVIVIAARAQGTAKGTPEAPERSDQREGEENDTSVVKAIHPKKDPNLVISVQQLLNVEPFFEAEIRSQVAGVVSWSQKEIGDRVNRGEMIITIDVPEVQQDLLEKKAMVMQRENEVHVAEEQVENARAAVEVTRESIEQRRAEWGMAGATRDYRKKRWDRFVELAKGEGIKQNIVEEEERDYRSAEFAVTGAAAATRKASADLKEKQSSLRIALADVRLKESLVEVARKARDRTRALLEFSRITAPFDGVVTKRGVDEGTFVQNASTARTDPLLTIARTDIVTVVMRVPDNAAQYVSRNTEAVLQFDELPGVVIRGKVTRYSPSIQNKDRTMRVEVDLYNDTPENYAQFRARCVGTWMAGMAGTDPLSTACLLAGSRWAWSRDSKSKADPFPMMPQVEGKGVVKPLIPGMSGYMRLNLRRFEDAYLIPSSAVFTRGGKPYLLVVDDKGLTKLLPVRVQVNDGKLAKVTVIVREGSPTKGEPEVLRDLTKDETIILNRQTEIGEGLPVKVEIEKNW